MSCLLVAQTDGRVLAEFPSWDAALEALDRLEREDPELAEGLSLVHFHEHEGAWVGVDSSLTVRSLT